MIGPEGGGTVVARSWRVVTALAAVAIFALVWSGAYQTREQPFFEPYTWPALQSALGVAVWMLAGVVLWGRAATRRLGTLMVLGGGTTAVARLIDSAIPVLFSVGLAVQWLGFVFFLWAVLGYPTGHLRVRTDRWMVAATATAAVLHGFVAGLMYDPVLHWPWCDSCYPGMNLLMIRPVPVVVDAIYLVLITTLGLVGGYAAVVLLRRWYLGTPLARRVRGPMLLPAVIYGAVVALFHFYELAGEIGLIVLPLPLAQVGIIGWFAQLLLPVTFLVGLARARARRGRVADLVTELGGPSSTDRLEEALRRTLRDPSLVVGYRSPSGGYVGADGTVVEAPTNGERAMTAIEGDGGPLAVLVHDPALVEDARLLESTTAAARLAVENARLAAELEAQLHEVRASRSRIVHAGDEARRRVERDLHDGAQQRLVSVSMLLRRARARPGAPPELDEAIGELQTALGELRDLARGVYPVALTEGGLAAALDGLAERAGVPTRVEAAPAERLPAAVESAAYFVVNEAVTNATKHAAASAVVLCARMDGDLLVVEVRDDGRGGARIERGGGLRGLADRVEALDGTLTVISPVGAGTTVRVELPCGSS